MLFFIFRLLGWENCLWHLWEFNNNSSLQSCFLDLSHPPFSYQFFTWPLILSYFVLSGLGTVKTISGLSAATRIGYGPSTAARGPGAAATWIIISMWCIWDPFTILIGRGGRRWRSRNCDARKFLKFFPFSIFWSINFLLFGRRK